MNPKLKFYQCIIPSLTCYVYAASEEEARSEVEKRIDRAAPILSDPTFDNAHPGHGTVHVGYEPASIAIGRAIIKRLYVAARVNGETLPAFFVTHDPLTGDPVGENDPE